MASSSVSETRISIYHKHESIAILSLLVVEINSKTNEPYINIEPLRNPFFIPTMKKYQIIILTLILILSLHNAIGESIPWSLPKPQKIVLSNGLTVILQEDHRAQVAAIQMWVRAGSGDEKDTEAGLSHVLEHMLFKGTEKRGIGEIARDVESSGGWINAYTSFDQTVYILVVPRESLKAGIDIISDAIQHSTLDPEELRNELEVVMEEVRRQEDSPASKLDNSLFATAYSVHPYRRPVIGLVSALNEMKRESIVAHYRDWYVPNNMTLVMSGDFSPQDVLPLIKESFASFKKKNLPPRPRPFEPVQKERREVILQEDIKEARFSIGYHIPGIKNKDVYALDVLSKILGEGESSHLVRKVKEEGQLVNSIASYSYTPRDPGLFMVEASLETDKFAEALRTTLDEMSLLAQRAVTDEEIARAKLNLVSHFLFQAETSEGLANQLGYFETVAGDIGFREKYTSSVEAVTPEDVMATAKKYLVETNMTIACLFPRGKASQNLDALLSAKPRSLIVKSREQGTDGVTKILFDQGPIILIKEDHSNPIVALNAVFEGGQRDEKKGMEGAFNFMAGMLTKGTQRRDADTIAKELDSMAGSLGASSGRTHFVLSGKVLSRYLDRYLDLYLDVLLHPSFPAQETEKERREILMELKNQEDSLSLVTFRLFAKTLYGEHPLGKDPLGNTKSISRISNEDLKRLYKTNARSEGLIMAVVGDIRTEEIVSTFASALSSLPGGRAPRAEVSSPKPSRTQRKETKNIKGKEQVHYLLGFLATTLLDEDRFALHVLTQILSNMGGRLFVELRDKRSLAYAVSAVLSEGLFDRGYFAVYLACEPSKLNEAVEETINVLRKACEEGVTEEEVVRAKNYIIGNHKIALQGSSALASTLALNEAYGLGYSFYLAYPQKIDKVTRKDVLRVARAYLLLDRPTLAVVGSLTGQKASR